MGSTFSYFYVVLAPTDDSIQSFTVDVSRHAGIATLGNITTSSSAYAGNAVLAGVSVTWNFNNLTGVATNSFTSQYSPVVFGIGSARTAGISGSWTSPVTDIPVPVPEASTILAGIMMTLPLGISAFRAIRKARA